MRTAAPTSIFELVHYLERADLPSYKILRVTSDFVVFDATLRGSGLVMIPTELLLEWLRGVESGLLDLKQDSQTNRAKMKVTSKWAKHLQDFDSHIWNVVQHWYSQPT
jgi:hypothetical protein